MCIALWSLLFQCIVKSVIKLESCTKSSYATVYSIINEQEQGKDEKEEEESRMF